MKVLIVLQFLLILVSGQSSDYDYFDDCSANIACLTDFEPHEHCLPLDYLCDVYIDCLDGADESPPLNCFNHSIVCSSGLELPIDLLCNGYDDCGTGEDEPSNLCFNKCLPPYSGGCGSTDLECIIDEHGGVQCVPKNQLSCPGGNVSLGLSQLCDGTVSCPNGEDEGNTGELSCNYSSFVCIPGLEEVPLTVMCDGVADCTNGRDETSDLCADKCQLPYSGGCSLEHRVCFTDELNTVECGECILGYNADIPGGECSLKHYLYPYGDGAGDSVIPPANDASSSQIFLSQPFPFFGQERDIFYVSIDGVISLEFPFTYCCPDPFPYLFQTPPLVAPFWSNADTTRGGDIFYRETADPLLLQKFSEELMTATGFRSFVPTTLFIATWFEVPPSETLENLNNTFQAVMATDGESSFISFVYVDIQWGAGAHIGLSDGGGVEYITESISFTNATVNMDLMSNVNISGVFFYRVDGKATDNLICPGGVFPIAMSELCDGIPHCFGGEDEGSNGAFHCEGSNSTFICFSGEEEVPLTALCDGYSDCSNSADERNTYCIDKCQPPYSGGCGFMNRECLNTELGGAYCGDCLPGFSVKVSGGECTLRSFLYPYGTEDDLEVPPYDDGTTPPFRLSQSFPFFESEESTLYVNTNGVISFRNPYTQYYPTPFPLATPLVAPFWNDVDIRAEGAIFYRETFDPLLRQRYSEELLNLVDITFSPSMLFIATWLRVPGFGTIEGGNTFQVVMATDGATSFISFVYVDIQWGGGAGIGFNSGDQYGLNHFMVPGALTSTTLDMELQSNINVPGVFLYHVNSEDTVNLTSMEIYTSDRKNAVNEWNITVEVCVGIVHIELEVVPQFLFLYTSDDTAQESLDYLGSQQTVLFLPEYYQCITIEVINDVLDEENEKFTVTVDRGNGIVKTVEITIVDDDITPIGFDQPEYPVGESSGSVTVCVRAEGQLGKSLHLVLSTVDGTATGGLDYNSTEEIFVFSSTIRRHCVTVSLLGDRIDEDHEFFMVECTGHQVKIHVKVFILDDDVALITFEHVVYKFEESTVKQSVCAVVSGELGKEVLVRISCEDRTAIGGVDYLQQTAEFLFGNGTLRHCFEVQLIDDQLDENDELFLVELSGPSSSTTSSLCGTNEVTVSTSNDTEKDYSILFSASVYIVDDDVTEIEFEFPVHIFTESGDTVEVCLLSMLPLAHGRSVTVQVKTEDGTAQGNSDYLPTSQMLTFDAFSSKKCVPVQLLTSFRDVHMEEPEIFYLSVGGERTTTVIILESHFFYPYGEKVGDRNVTQTSDAFNLTQPFPFFGTNETVLYVHSNGIITFRCLALCQPNATLPPLIFPLLSNDEVTRRGIVHFRETRDENLLKAVHYQFEDLPVSLDFLPTSLFIATWENVTGGFASSGLGSTFQAVLATNGISSYVLLIYGWVDIHVVTPSATVSDGDVYLDIQESDATSFREGSNVGVPGIYIFQVDPELIQNFESVCDDWDLRLALQSTKLDRLLEVCIRSTWRRLIVTGWGDTNANVSCKQLGFLSGVNALETPEVTEKRPTDYQTIVRCLGTESHLLECEHEQNGTSGSGMMLNETSGSGLVPDQLTVTNGTAEVNGSLPLTTAGVRCTALQIGFQKSSYTVEEGDMYLIVCAGLATPVDRSVSVTLSTVYTHSAEGTTDYSASVTDVRFTASSLECVNITIVDDDKVESNENFLLILHTTDQAVVIDPQYAFVTILDDDTKTDIQSSVTATVAANTSLATSLPVPESPAQKSSMDPVVAVASSVSSAILVLLMASVVVVLGGCIVQRRRVKRKRETAWDAGHFEMIANGDNPYATFLKEGKSTGASNSAYLEQLSTDLLIPSCRLRLLDSIGQGEFGIVYKGHLTNYRKRRSSITIKAAGSMPVAVAVKTLKGFYDQSQIDEMLRESVKMCDFDHPNVLPLIGVCIDGGPTPYIVTPFMSNGSLQSYLKKYRTELILDKGADESEEVTVKKRLLEMCHQIAKGMEYLAGRNFIHRDLATRNCMIDFNFVIKVADFGLSESTCSKTYFREKEGSAVKLPIKWMAPESLSDAVFTEKTDVWSYGVTCWEVFSGGKAPYPGVDPVSLAGMLENGYRMEKPNNAACSDDTYAIVLKCWDAEPTQRPTFAQLVMSFSGILTSMSDYMDMNTFSVFCQTGDSPQEIEKLVPTLDTIEDTDPEVDVADEPVSGTNEDSAQKLQ